MWWSNLELEAAIHIGLALCQIENQPAFFPLFSWHLHVRSATEWTASGTYFTHVQTCDVNRVQSATEWTASVHTLYISKPVMEPVFKVLRNGLLLVHSLHMSKPVMQTVFRVLRNGLLRYILYTCPNLWCNPWSKCYGMDCFGTYFTHVQTCDVTHVQSATEWTASVHTLHMSKPVM